VRETAPAVSPSWRQGEAPSPPHPAHAGASQAAVVLLGPVHLMGRGLEPLLDRRRRGWARGPSAFPSSSCSTRPPAPGSAWRGGGMRDVDARHSSSVRSRQARCLTNRSWTPRRQQLGGYPLPEIDPARNRDSAAARSTRAAGRDPRRASCPAGTTPRPAKTTSPAIRPGSAAGGSSAAWYAAPRTSARSTRSPTPGARRSEPASTSRPAPAASRVGAASQRPRTMSARSSKLLIASPAPAGRG